jgi:hypothetical protein
MISRKRGKNGGKELTAGGACLGGEKRTMGHGKGKKREGGVGERNRRRVRVEARDLLAFLDARAVLADICSIADPMDVDESIALPFPLSPFRLSSVTFHPRSPNGASIAPTQAPTCAPALSVYVTVPHRQARCHSGFFRFPFCLP